MQKAFNWLIILWKMLKGTQIPACSKTAGKKNLVTWTYPQDFYEEALHLNLFSNSYFQRSMLSNSFGQISVSCLS